MAKVDWSEEQGETWRAGAYHVEVMGCIDKPSSKGHAMLNVRLGAIDHGKKTLAFDNIMLAGGGRGMGTAKLVALGIPKGQAEVEADELLGKRAYAYVIEETYNGRTSMKVAVSEGSHCGYWLESEKDDVKNLVLPEVPRNFGEDNPFGDLEPDGVPF